MVRSIKITVIITFILAQSFGNGLAAERINVFTSILPQKYFVQQIGKELVDVQVMVQPGANPVTYEPKPRQMAALSRAQLYFAIGVPFETVWLKKIVAANPRMKVVHTDHGIEKRAMASHNHDDGTDRHHEYNRPGDAARDPHIWLSPPLVKIQARTIMEALGALDPEHRHAYEANYREFVSRIDALDADLKRTFAGKTGLAFMVFHPSWGYFAQTYGLNQVPIEIEGKSPKPAQLKALIGHARETGIRVVFVQPQFSTKSAELVAREIGGQVAFADPLAEDWLANLREIAGKFKLALN